MTDASPGTGSRAEPPLWMPYYDAPFLSAVRRFFAKYATFAGRAGRAEFWWMWLVLFAFPTVVQLVNGLTTGDWRPIDGSTVTTVPDVVVLVFTLATLLPGLAIIWRRLHDTGRSGAWFFFGFIPLVGPIVLVVFFLLPPVDAGRRYDTPAPGF